MWFAIAPNLEKILTLKPDLNPGSSSPTLTKSMRYLATGAVTVNWFVFMPKHVLFVCKSCNFSPSQEQYEGQSGGSHLLSQLSALYQDWSRQTELEIQSVSCLCTCDRPCVVALAGINKPTYLFGDLPPLESAAALLQLGELYIDSDDGAVSKSKLPEVLKPARLAWIPPWPQAPNPASH